MTNRRERPPLQRTSHSASAARAWRAVLDYLPTHSTAWAARRLALRANAARDAIRYPLAAALYEEALRLRPNQPRLHIQCGHMFKEAGDYASAEEHYLQAVGQLPADADLALQLGHFYKVAMRPDEAEAAYRRALDLRPGWDDASDELARIRGALGTEDIPALSEAGFDGIVPELLPQPVDQPIVHRDRLRVTHLAPRRMRSAWGMMKVLRGVEAIRGYYLSAIPPEAIQLLLDGEEIRRAPLQGFPIPESPDQQKYVFNIWHDFADTPPGLHRLELRVIDARLIARKHVQNLIVAPPWGEQDWPDSDGVVDVSPTDPRSIEDQINARPSMVRSAQRTPLPSPLRTILVQRADQLGDLVCSVPAIRRLRELFPEARLVGLLTASNVDLGRALGLFDDVVLAEFGEQPGRRRRVMSAESQIRLQRTLAPYDIDLAIDLCEVSDSRPLLLLSGARFLYGFRPKESPFLHAGFEFQTIDGSDGLEAAAASRKILALVEALGALREGAAQPILLPDRDWSRLERYGIADEERFVVLHTGARLAFSRWPGFAALTSLLLERTPFSVVLMGEEMPTGAGAAGNRVHRIPGLMPFDDFDALLSLCSGFVGNDSGTKHLAALRGAPVISLHMARLNWNEWGQEMTGSIISRRVPCAGCAIHHSPEECGRDFACLRMITAEEVFAALLNATGGSAG